MDKRPPRPQPPRRAEPSGIELPPGLWAGIAAAASSVPAAPAAEPVPAGRPDWRAELLAEHGGPTKPAPFRPEDFEAPPSAPPDWIPPPVDGRSVKARPSPLGPGERKLLPRPEPQDAHPPQFVSWAPGDPVRGAGSYDQLIRYVYGPRYRALLVAMAREPLFAYAQARWRPAVRGTAWWLDHEGRAGNQELLDHLYDRVAQLMGTYFAFEPAPMVHMPKMYPNALGVYMPSHHVLALCGRLLQAPLYEAVDTLVHEQTHALQYQRMFAELRGEGSAVEPYERSLVRRWLREQPVIREIPYQQRAIELQAHAFGGGAAEVIKALAPSPAP